MDEHIETTSRDMLSDQLERFSAIFPQFVKEGEVNVEAIGADFALSVKRDLSDVI